MRCIACIAGKISLCTVVIVPPQCSPERFVYFFRAYFFKERTICSSFFLLAFIFSSFFASSCCSRGIDKKRGEMEM